MNENELLIKNRLREATVILERANLIICDESWKCDSSRPPFSSFQLVMQGEGTVQVDQTVLHPHAGQLYLREDAILSGRPVLCLPLALPAESWKKEDERNRISRIHRK